MAPQNTVYCTIKKPAGHSNPQREYRVLSTGHGFASVTPRNLTGYETGAGFEIEISDIAAAWIETHDGQRFDVNLTRKAQDEGKQDRELSYPGRLM